METEEYDSLEEFWTRSDAAADVPDVTLLGLSMGIPSK